MNQRQILHIEVGDKNWTPTSDELAKIVHSFMHARDDEKGGVVATRNGVKVKKHIVPEGIAIACSEGEAIALSPYERLKLDIHASPDYQGTWQSNIAMAIYDNQKGKISAQRANKIADAIMQRLFLVEPRGYTPGIAEVPTDVHTPEDPPQ